jgi:hypothetical protein
VPGFSKQSSWLKQDKGREVEMQGFIDRVEKGGEPLMPPDHIWNVTEATFAAVESAQSGGLVPLAQSPAPPATRPAPALV